MRNPSKIIRPRPITTPMPKKNPRAAYNWQPVSPYSQLQNYFMENYFNLDQNTHDPANDEDAENGNWRIDMPRFISRKLHNNTPDHCKHFNLIHWHHFLPVGSINLSLILMWMVSRVMLDRDPDTPKIEHTQYIHFLWPNKKTKPNMTINWG